MQELLDTSSIVAGIAAKKCCQIIGDSFDDGLLGNGVEMDGPTKFTLQWGDAAVSLETLAMVANMRIAEEHVSAYETKSKLTAGPSVSALNHSKSAIQKVTPFPFDCGFPPFSFVVTFPKNIFETLSTTLW